jgi:Tfp pilus assembly protein PilF
VQEGTDYLTELHYSVGTVEAARAAEQLEAGQTERAATSDLAAREHLALVLERDPRYASAHANLGVLELRAKNFERADQHFREALRFEPSHGVALEGRRRSLLAQGRTIEARRHILEIERIRRAVRQEALTR